MQTVMERFANQVNELEYAYDAYSNLTSNEKHAFIAYVEGCGCGMCKIEPAVGEFILNHFWELYMTADEQAAFLESEYGDEHVDAVARGALSAKQSWVRRLADELLSDGAYLKPELLIF